LFGISVKSELGQLLLGAIGLGADKRLVYQLHLGETGADATISRR
jgi:hypothetical protein